MSSAQDSLAEIRASQVKQKLKNFEQLMNRGPRALSHSQNNSVNVYLGRLFENVAANH